ncbi:MAG: hypothetical protein H7Z16_02265 [Pyrinomonadaceae bacterium]|nr:hypothetical protein [Pyrinomonadaceae bacterium]
MNYRETSWKAFFVTGIILLSLAALSFGTSAVAAGHSVTNITLDPPTPNILVHNQKVTISFSYATTQPGGVRIFARPFTGGAATPHYAASAAQVSPSGSGTGSQFFTITSGDVTVDRIRIQMWNANQTVLLFQAFLPVNYQFRAP